MTGSSSGPVLVAIGAGIVILGLLVWAGGLSWCGRLPGDIRIERETVRMYIPLVSMLVISIVLTVLLNLISRFF